MAMATSPLCVAGGPGCSSLAPPYPRPSPPPSLAQGPCTMWVSYAIYGTDALRGTNARGQNWE